MPDVKPVVRNVRLTPEFDAEVVALAKSEVDGNVSLMLRKLLREALAARSAPQPAAQVTVVADMVREAARSPQPTAVPFYEDDEPVEQVVAAFERGEQGVTAKPAVRTAKVDPVFQTPVKPSKMPDPSDKVAYGRWVRAGGLRNGR